MVCVAAEPAGPVVAITSGLEVYQTGLLRGMRGILAEAGIPLIAYVNSDADPHGAPTGVQPGLRCLLEHHRPRGVVVTTSMSGPQAEALSRLIDELRLPVVHIGEERPGATCVRGDNERGTAALMAHLLDGCGVRRPVFVRGLDFQDDHVVRERVFRRELAARGIEVDERLVLEGRAWPESTREALERLLETRRDFDAVITTDDWCALAAVEAVTGAGLQVPLDVAVTGFDNYPAAGLTWPGLTTVDQGLEEQGATAARLLLELVGGAGRAGLTLTPAGLVVRGSSSRQWQAERPGSTEAAIRSAQTHQRAYDAVRRLSRELLPSRSLADVADALASCLPPLEIRRCFLVVPDGDGADGTARLVLDYRDGRARPVPDAAFAACDRLPAHLLGELERGFLTHQPLLGTNGPLGYVLTDQPLGPVPTADSLRTSLTRTLEIISHTQELAGRVEERTTELRSMQRELVDTARRAGMAEIATNVLHNVGNVLNSVNVSAGLVSSRLRESKWRAWARSRAAGRARRRPGRVPARRAGPAVPGYLSKLADTLAGEQAELVTELAQLTENIDHIKEIVATQQSYAGASGVVEPRPVAELVEDAVRMNAESLSRHEVEVRSSTPGTCRCGWTSTGVLILVNLIKNAKHAKRRAASVRRNDPPVRIEDGALQVSVADNGAGIPRT